MDERDPLLSQAYREAEHPEPPAALDARILAAARQAVTPNPPRRRSWFAWAVPLSTTAVLIVAVSLLLKEYRKAPETVQDRNPARTSRPQAAAPASKPLGEAATPASRNEVSGTLSANGQTTAQRAPSRRLRPAPPIPPEPASPGNAVSAPPAEAAAQPQPFPAPAAAEPRESEPKQVPVPAATPDFAESAAGAGRASAAADQAPAGAAVSAQPRNGNMEQRKAATPRHEETRQMVAEIRRLLREGRETEARGILDALRKRHPDYPLPDDLSGLR